MQPRELFDSAAAILGDALFGFQEAAGAEAKEGPRDACFRVRPERLLQAMTLLRDTPAWRFDFLQNLTAVDWFKRDVMELVYHLFSYAHRHSACVKVELPRADPRVASLAGLWPTANWLEREQFDLLGVIFEGHPDLRRLLMPDDWVGHPMRKDFREPKSYRGMPTSRPSPLDLLATYDRAHPAAPRVAPAAVAGPVPTPATKPDSGDSSP